MSNKLIINSLLIILFLSVSCKSNINIHTFTDEYPIIIKLSNKYHKVYKIKIPVVLKIDNNTRLKEEFITIDYKYGNINKGITEHLFKKKNNELVNIDNNTRKTIYIFNSDEFVIYSSHKIDSTASTQLQFEPYIKKMLSLKKDTLHTGVDFFKKKHDKLFKTLIKNDSISVQFLDNNSESGLGQKITIPVKF